jgi:hypothetical protein
MRRSKMASISYSTKILGDDFEFHTDFEFEADDNQRVVFMAEYTRVTGMIFKSQESEKVPGMFSF